MNVKNTNTKNIQVILPIDIVKNITKSFQKIDDRVSVQNTSDFLRYCILHTIQKKPTDAESSNLLITAGDMCRFRKALEDLQK